MLACQQLCIYQSGRNVQCSAPNCFILLCDTEWRLAATVTHYYLLRYNVVL